MPDTAASHRRVCPAPRATWPAALAAATLGAALLGGCAGGTDELSDTQAAPRAVDPGYSATEAQVIETDAAGAPRYTLRAAAIQQDPRSLEVTLERLSMQVTDGSDTPWQMTAASGRMPQDASRIELSGDVRVAGSVGRGAEPIEIRTESLSYDIAPGLARSDADVSIWLSGKWLAARGMQADLKQRRVRLESKVHGRFVP